MCKVRTPIGPATRCNKTRDFRRPPQVSPPKVAAVWPHITWKRIRCLSPCCKTFENRTINSWDIPKSVAKFPTCWKMLGRASHAILIHCRGFRTSHRGYAALQRVAGPFSSFFKLLFHISISDLCSYMELCRFQLGPGGGGGDFNFSYLDVWVWGLENRPILKGLNDDNSGPYWRDLCFLSPRNIPADGQ